MKRTTFLKTIVLAAAILGGVSSAWADDVTTLYYRTVSGTESSPTDAAEQAWATTDYDGTTTGSWTGDVGSVAIVRG